MSKNVLVTGGSGYTGSKLVAKLLKQKYIVRVLSLFVCGDNLSTLKRYHNLSEIKGDIRDRNAIKKSLTGADYVFHLANVPNDVTTGVDPKIIKSINYDATINFIDMCKKSGVKRFIFASSSSVYGNRSEKEVTEKLLPCPITKHSKYKIFCENYLLSKKDDKFEIVIIRPAQVFGYSPGFRMDLSFNKMTIDALIKKKIVINGGEQQRAQIHIDDLTRFYLNCLSYPSIRVNGEIFNISCGNYTIYQLARIIKKTLNDKNIKIETLPQADIRSYRISSKKARRILKFIPQKTFSEAIMDIKRAYFEGKIHDPYTNPRYYSLERLKKI